MPRELELRKAKAAHWLNRLSRAYELIAPVKKNGDVVFESVSDTAKIALDYQNTLVSPKEYFLPQTEDLFRYQSKEFDIIVPELPEPRIIFGIRPCDVQALVILDKVLDNELRDEYWVSKRAATTLVALGCNEPSERCFCGPVKAGPFPEAGYDILLTDIGDAYFTEVASEKGAALIAGHERLFRRATAAGRRKRAEVVAKAHELTGSPLPAATISKLMKARADDPMWKELGDRCIQCGGCTYICPTCWCFDVVDRAENGTGVRMRNWDCCLMPGFTKMAGGLNPRDTPESRIKQRFYHKWDYFVERYGILQCVGCGRCSETAPCGINWEKVFQKVVGEAA